MSAQLRPDNLGVVIDAHPLTNIGATLFLFWESTTDALRKPDVQQLIENIIGSGNNIILALSPGNKIGTWFRENLDEQTKATQEQAVLKFWEKLHSAKREKRTRPDS